jgi:hypothetical protein
METDGTPLLPHKSLNEMRINLAHLFGLSRSNLYTILVDQTTQFLMSIYDGLEKTPQEDNEKRGTRVSTWQSGPEMNYRSDFP